jgi:hypothetical protein
LKRPAKLAAFAAIAITAAATLAFVLNPLRGSDASVHAYLLDRVPPGSTLETLQGVAQREGWRVNGTWQRGPDSDWGGIDGATVAWIYLGGYWNVFRTDLDSFWAFDEQGRLLDVRIRRMTDAI